MSGETQTHVDLVRQVASVILFRHSHLYSFTILIDLPEFGLNRPGRIGGFEPDVLGRDCPETTLAIGEAKTAFDFDTAHSQAQIAAFLKRLTLSENGFFYLSVPQHLIIHARNRISSTISENGWLNINFEVIGG